jgi:hypothetical protein
MYEYYLLAIAIDLKKVVCTLISGLMPMLQYKIVLIIMANDGSSILWLSTHFNNIII